MQLHFECTLASLINVELTEEQKMRKEKRGGRKQKSLWAGNTEEKASLVGRRLPPSKKDVFWGIVRG